MNAHAPVPLHTAIETWIWDTPLLAQQAGAASAVEHLLNAELRSPNTRKAYYHALRRFFIAAQAQEFESLRHIDGLYIRRYLDGMISKRGTASAGLSRALAYAALNRFFDAMVLAKSVDRNPCAGVHIVVKKAAVEMTPAFTRDEYAQLMEKIDPDPMGGRDRALFSLLAHTAARIGAALKVTKAHFYEDPDGKPRVKLDEKGGKIHSMPVSAELAADLAPYLEALGPLEPDEYLFRHWDPVALRLTKEPLPYFEAQALLRVRLRNAKITRRLTFHSFRATAITRMLDTGTRLDDVQKMANHAQITTTLRYDRRGNTTSEEFGEKLSQALKTKGPVK